MGYLNLFKCYFISFFFLSVVIGCTSQKSNSSHSYSGVVIPVNPELIIKENMLKEVYKESHVLNGIETECYVITVRSEPTEHSMGPWCPKSISDSKEKAGIWFDDGKVYDVSGHFIANLKEFYEDERWSLLREDSTIKVTTSQESCEGAAKPDVEEQYRNHCVECLPSYYEDFVTTYVIPVNPIYLESSSRLSREGLGLALNGVNYDPPAPTHAILAAHTIAPLDDHGGHVNPHEGYHYHAVTGSTKEVAQKEVHAPLVGYALDGFGIYALKIKKVIFLMI